VRIVGELDDVGHRIPVVVHRVPILVRGFQRYSPVNRGGCVVEAHIVALNGIRSLHIASERNSTKRAEPSAGLTQHLPSQYLGNVTFGPSVSYPIRDIESWER